METEVCVVGGGPAGATVALRLARLGHEVVLVERDAFPRRHVGESLAPSILPLLEHLGLRRQIESAGFLRPRAARLRWAGAPRWREDPGEPGFQVDRGRFDAILLDAARGAGARIVQPARARVEERGDGWRLRLESDGGARELRAAYLVDARGRRAARRRERLAPPMLALYGYWRGTAIDGPETRIEAEDAAWLWAAPLPDGTVDATAFVEPRRARAEGVAPAELYRRLLARSELLAGCLEGELITPVRACDATPVADPEPIFPGGLRVGEAAFAIDPLSSQGVQVAIRSALQAAAVVHTLLRPDDDGPANDAVAAATDFYRARIAETAGRHARMAARFYAAEAHGRPAAFWHDRARVTGAVADTAAREPPRPRPLPDPGDVVRLAPAARLEPTPVLLGDRVARRPALVHPALERPLAFVAGHDVAPLLVPLGNGVPAGSLVAAWSTVVGDRAARELFESLWRHGVLIAS